MNLSKQFQLVNPGKLGVYLSLLTFSLFMSLWMDGLIRWSIWIVFLPLWLWKMLIIFGSVIGIGVWCYKPEARYERGSFVQFRAMIISTALHLLLILFEILICIRLENVSAKFPWTLVFSPLLFSSLLSIVLCLWAIKNDRGFEMELLCCVNSLQFVFIAIKLDGFVSWSWLLVLIPLWITMSVAFIFMIYAIIVAAILMKTSDSQAENRRVTVNTALSYVFIVIPLIVYAVLLVGKLEGLTQLYYSLAGIPLYIALITLTISAFSSRPGNIWWFGLRKDFCQFLIVDACPCLQEYGNISYKVQFNDSSNREVVAQQEPINDEPSPEHSITSSPAKHSNKELLSTPVVLIEMPD
ncbi:transmembrane protein 185-like [Watersipora subatra]|uniref:transmembrane protein 185-like n=1 Tax=Watersipora subatra TaxID=2589382 RepID=UPI00355AD79D